MAKWQEPCHTHDSVCICLRSSSWIFYRIIFESVHRILTVLFSLICHWYLPTITHINTDPSILNGNVNNVWEEIMFQKSATYRILMLLMLANNIIICWITYHSGPGIGEPTRRQTAETCSCQVSHTGGMQFRWYVCTIRRIYGRSFRLHTKYTDTTSLQVK